MLAGFATVQFSVVVASESVLASASPIALSTAVVGSLSTATPSAVAGLVNTHIVEVGGPNGSLAFYPNNVVAAPGDLVQFHFHPKVTIPS
jgi:plastocyanin